MAEKNERQPISKKMRFDVFKRDAFTCQYCGATPPGSLMHVDHINPVKNGGKNHIANLITSCQSCNLGKGAGLLIDVPKSVETMAANLAEKMAQVKAYNRLVKRQEKMQDKLVAEIQSEFQEHYQGWIFSDRFVRSIRFFLEKIPVKDLVRYIGTACRNTKSAEGSTKYFCAMCWNTIKEAKQ